MICFINRSKSGVLALPSGSEAQACALLHIKFCQYVAFKRSIGNLCSAIKYLQSGKPAIRNIGCAGNDFSQVSHAGHASDHLRMVACH